jgi:hypothetical protein
MLKCEFLEIIVNRDSSGVEFKRDDIRNFSLLSQPNPKPSEHQCISLSTIAIFS